MYKYCQQVTTILGIKHILHLFTKLLFIYLLFFFFFHSFKDSHFFISENIFVSNLMKKCLFFYFDNSLLITSCDIFKTKILRDILVYDINLK